MQHDIVTEVVDNRVPPRERVEKGLRSYGVGPRHARNVEQLLLLPLAGDEVFNMWNGLLIDLLAPGCEAEERVHRPLFAGLGVFSAHARRVERAVVPGGEWRVLEREGRGEVGAADGFLEAARADEQRGVAVAVPVGILEAAGALANRQRGDSRDVIDKGRRITGKVHLVPSVDVFGVAGTRRVEVTYS